MKTFVAKVLGDTEDVWDGLFRDMDSRPYPKPTVVLVSGATVSGCGLVNVASGPPLYCAADARIYLDLTFLRELDYRAGGFAAAYVLVHEVGHHVQNVLGATRQSGPSTNQTQNLQDAQMQARLAMQADCYVGVWTYSVQKRGLVDPQEVKDGSAAALTVATAPSGGGYVDERRRGFEEGLATGDPRSCDLSALPPTGSGRRR